MTQGKNRALTFVASRPSSMDALSAWPLVNSSHRATSSRTLQPGCLRGICLQVVRWCRRSAPALIMCFQATFRYGVDPHCS